MVTAAFILLCVAVIISNAPVPRGNWFSIGLAVLALILFCLASTRSFAQVDYGPGRKVMSHVETRSHRIAPPPTQARLTVLRSGEARLFFITAN